MPPIHVSSDLQSEDFTGFLCLCLQGSFSDCLVVQTRLLCKLLDVFAKLFECPHVGFTCLSILVVELGNDADEPFESVELTPLVSPALQQFNLEGLREFGDPLD